MFTLISRHNKPWLLKVAALSLLIFSFKPETGQAEQHISHNLGNDKKSDITAEAVLPLWKPTSSDYDVTHALVVDAKGSAMFTTITAALQAAEEDAHILVKPGLYRETLVVRKPVHLIADNASDTFSGRVTVISQKASPLYWFARTGSIRGFTFRQTGLEHPYFGVSVGGGGWPVLAHNRIFSKKGAGLGVYDAATPVVENNEILFTGEAGILVYGQSGGLFYHNTIHDTGFAGIEVIDHSSPSFYGNKIYNSRQGGLLIDNAQGLFENNQIYANRYAGIEIRNQADPLILHNVIRNNGESGVLIRRNGYSKIMKNLIYHNKLSGIEITGHGQPLVQQNRVCHNQGAAVSVDKDAAGDLRRNLLLTHHPEAVRIHPKAGKVILTQNQTSLVPSSWLARLRPSLRQKRTACIAAQKALPNSDHSL